MAKEDLIQRAGSLLFSALDDDDLRKQLRDAAKSGRSTVSGLRARRRPPAPTLVARAGQTVRASGAALTSLGRVEEPEPKRRGRTVVALAIAGGLVAATAARTQNHHQGGTHGV